MKGQQTIMYTFTKLGAFLFGIVATLHLIRLITRWEVTIGGMEVPVWVSGVGFAVTFTLCLGLLREANRPGRPGADLDK